MKKQCIIIIIMLLCGASCVSLKDMPTSSASYNQAVNIAIRDFMLKHSNNNKDCVFDIGVYTHETFYKQIDSNILVVDLCAPHVKLYPRSTDTIGSIRGYMPTQYAIFKGKLFYWRDPEYFLNKEIVDVLNQFNMIDSINVKDTAANFFETAFDDSGFGLIYYFCMDNLHNYTSTKMSTLRHKSKVPKLDCSKQKRIRAK